jgi:hypothetical protein
MVAGESSSSCHSASTWRANSSGPERLHQDLDARLVDVVAAPVTVIEPQDRLDVGEHVPPRQELANHLADDRRAAHAAAHDHADADLALRVLHHVKADVVQERGGAIAFGTRERDLEFARQVGELRMERGPLPQDLGEGARVDDLVGRDAGEVIGGDVADAVAAGLDRVHLDFGEVGEDVGHVRQARPVELDVLARGEVAVAAIVLARDVRELAQLGADSSRREWPRAASAHGAGCRARSAAAAGGTRRP